MRGPFLFETEVKPEWIDYNGHMNVAYYVLAFDHAIDDFYGRLGLGEAYAPSASTTARRWCRPRPAMWPLARKG